MQTPQNGEKDNSVGNSSIAKHAVVLYGSDDDMISSMIPLLTESLSDNKRMCLCIFDDIMYLEMTSKLAEAGIDTEGAQNSEKLNHLVKTDVFLKNGTFDIEKTFTIFRSIAEASKSYGFTRMDVFTDMSWTLPKILNRAEYEVRLNTLQMPLDFHMFCLYDLRKFSSDSVMDALRTHELIYANGVQYRNPFCMPPDRLMHEDFSDLELEYALKIIREVYDIGTALALLNSGAQQMRDSITRLNGEKNGLFTELKELRLRFDQYSEGISDWIWELDADGNFNYTSTAVTYILGLQREDVLGKGLDYILMEEDKEAYLKAVEEAKCRIDSFGPLDLRASKNDEVIHLRISAVPLFHRNGSFLGYRGIAKDITLEVNSSTSIHELQEEINRLASSADEKEKALSALQADLSTKVAETAELHASLSALESQIASKDAELAAAAEALDSEKANLQELQEQLESKTHQVTITASSLTTFKGEVNRLTEKLIVQDTELSDTKAELEAQKADYESQIAAINSDLSIARADLAALNSSMEIKNTELLTLTAAAATLADEKQALNAQLTSLKADLGRNTSELTSLMSEIEELKRYKTQAAEFNEKLAVSQTETAELKKSLEIKTSEISTLSAAAAQLSDDKQSLAAELQSLKDDLKNTTSEMTASAAEIESLTNSNSQLTSKLKESDEIIAGLKSSVSDSESAISELSEKIAALESNSAEKDRELAILKEELDAKAQAVEKSDMAINEKNEEMARMVTLIASKEGELNDLHEKISVMHSNLESKLAEIKSELKNSCTLNVDAYYNLFDSSAEAVWIIDNDGATVFANNRISEMFGYSKEELQNKKPTSFMNQSWLSGENRKLSEERIICFVKKDGSDLWAMVSSIPLIDSDENPRGMMGILVDITELKKAAPAVKPMPQKDPNEFMDALSDALTAMLSNIALAKDYVIPEGRMYDKLLRAQEASEAAVKAVGYDKLPDTSAPLVFGKGRVLIIDDNDSVSESLSDLLTHLGYDPDFAADGEEGLQLAIDAAEDGKPFNAAVMDINSPGCLDMMPQIAAACPGIKIIASDVLANDPIAADPSAFGFAAAVSKPFSAGELSSILKSILQQ